jgi:alpha-glucosidase
MRIEPIPVIRAVIIGVILVGCSSAPISKRGASTKVTSVPESLNLDPFYKKHLDCGGIPIVSSERVADAALVRAGELISRMLADRPDLRAAMIESGVRFVIIGANEETTDVPEYSHMEPKAYVNERSRGFGGVMTSCGEENVLCLPIDRYDDESILIHEFGHCMDRELSRIDNQFRGKLRALYDKAIAEGLWEKTYAGSNSAEYWAEAVQSYYDANRQNNWNHNYVNTREELEAYDPDLAKFVAETLRHTKKTDWRYKPLARQPRATTPPESLDCDPFYKQYVYCRSFSILSSEKVPEAALLEANYLIREMFAYRHDILKAMIDADVRLVVLGAHEQVTDLPDCQGDPMETPWDRGGGGLIGQEPRKILCVGQENLLPTRGDPNRGESTLIRTFACALYQVTGQRPIDMDFENLPDRRRQQYELRVQRMDERFDAKLKAFYEEAMEKGLWRDTLAAKSRMDYWAEGVLSWFDANRQSPTGTPDGLHNRVNTREELEEYDPKLAELIAEVFLHPTRFDWRYQPPSERKTSEAKAMRKSGA